MALGYPLIVVVGSKGGVGTTTVAAGLLQTAQAQKMPVVGADLTATNDMTRVLDQRAVAISSLVRHRGRMPALIGKALRRKMALLALDLTDAIPNLTVVLYCLLNPVDAVFDDLIGPLLGSDLPPLDGVDNNNDGRRYDQ